MYDYTYTVTTNNSGTQYGTDDGVTYYRVYYTNNQWRKSNNSSGTVYTGTRYTRSNSQSWHGVGTMSGLSGQTLASNGYTWPSERRWYTEKSNNAGSGTQISFLDAFLPTSGGDETYYSSATTSTSSSNTKVYFYKENLDGSWLRVNEFDSGSSSVNFNISDKYNGFQAYQYSTDGESTWKDVGTYNAGTGYYGSQVSSSKLSIRFQRKKYELIYTYEDDNGEHYAYDTGKTVPYEKPLAEYDLAYTNALLNWSGCDITNRTFAGWYEDASLTVPFDFNGTMPDTKKIIYAKWSPLQHKVIIDPNGGELIANDSTWFYVDPEKNETIKEYHPTRDYRLDMHNGTYYYHYDPWDPLGDKHVTDTNSPSFIPNISRRAYYTLDIAQATSNEFSNPVNRYAYDPGAYAFMGWYEVLADGTLAIDPFSFGEPPTRDVTLRAIWRRMGIYTLKYESIDPDGRQATTILYDPQHNATGNIEDGYVADAETTLTKAPTNYDKEQWLWEGWQVIDTYNNNIPLTTIRSPGDVYIVRASHADLNNVIHLRAVFKHIGDSTSRHVPPVTDLILDSNENAGLAAGATVTPVTGRVGTYTDGATASVGGLNQGVWFAGQHNNFSVNLADYAADFAHSNGYFLLGWDPHRDLTSLIPTYYANETIGIDKESGTENILYAVWEPQIYIEFVNDTGAELSGVQLYIPGWTDGELFRVNSMQDTYKRERFAAFSEGTATFDIPSGERICLVLPDAADKDFAVMGACTYAEGNKLVITRIQPQIEGQETIPDVMQSIYPGEDYMVSGTMKVSPTPVQVRFTKATYLTEVNMPVRYFLHLTNTTDGVIREITHDDAYWQTVGGNARITNITVRSADIDLAAALRVDADTSVHGFLADVRPDDGALLREGFRSTTIGIGSATADFDEYRTITKRDPSGGSYIHYRREHVEWSRYSHVWNAYDDAAVYVVFYRREPVHVTVAKSVIGTEEDKTHKFDFTADFTERSKTLEYTVTTSYRKTRTLRSNAERGGFLNLSWDWSDTWTGPDWASCEEQIVSVGDPSTPALVSEDQFLFSSDGRESEDISLADGERHPFTIYYNKLQDTDPSRTVTTGGATSQSGISYYNSDGSERTGSSAGSGRYRTRTETTNWTQTVTYLVTYQYETVTIREKNDPDNLFVLSSIDGDPDNPLVNHNGTANVADRSYTISSLRGPDASGFYDYQLLDTAIFKNARKAGSLTVTKTVVDGDAGDTFPFTVTLGETVVGKDSYTPPAGVHLGPYGKVFTFTLANNGSMTLPGLPAGASYTVEEGAHAKYVATIPANATGTIEADATITVGVTNTRKTDIVIEMNGVTNYFNGAEQFGYDITTVTGTGSPVVADGYTVTGLKAGHVLTVEHHVPSHGTAVGEYTGDFSNARYTILDAGGNDVTQEYLVTTPVADTMTIKDTPVIVEIMGNTSTVTYDGEEHVCQGYTNVVKNAVTSEVIENESVLIAVDPNYQQVYRTDVGKVEMPLEGHVNVTLPEGFTLQEVTIVSKGYLEITPATATVTANNAGKIYGTSDPAFTATVEGMIGGDTLDYTVSRAAGDEPGTYPITPSGAAAQGNYTVTYNPGTLTIEKLELKQRSTETYVPVDFPVTDEMLQSIGFTSSDNPTPEAVNNWLNAWDPNGLMHWENLVTGTETNSALFSAIFSTSGSDSGSESSSGSGSESGSGSDAESELSLGIQKTPGVSTNNFGYTILYDLCKLSVGKWNRVAGPVEKAQELTPSLIIKLPPVSGAKAEQENPSGIYRVATLLVPNNNLSITNEIPTTNRVGVLQVASSFTNTITAIPWVELDTQSASYDKDVKVEDVVLPSGLSEGDTLYRYNVATGNFAAWTYENGSWEAVATVAKDGVSLEEAADAELTRGGAFWLVRKNPKDASGAPLPYYLTGGVRPGAYTQAINGGSETVPGKTLCANPTPETVGVNNLVFTDESGDTVKPDQKDTLEVPNGTGLPTVLFRNADNTKWGYYTQVQSGWYYTTVFKTNVTIAPGTGFWYIRRAGGKLSIHWNAWEDGRE